MDRPWLKLYTRDWLDDTELRKCSPIARATLADLMCMAHEGVPYGYLAVATGPIPERQLAFRAAMTFARFQKCVLELAAHQRIHRDDYGTLFIKRMVRDEEIRTARAEGGKLGGNPNLGRLPDKVNLVSQPISRAHMRADSDSDSDLREFENSKNAIQKTRDGEFAAVDERWLAAGFSGPEDFELWFGIVYAAHPQRGGLGLAKDLLRNALLAGKATKSHFESGYAAWRESREWKRDRGRYIPQLPKFCSDEGWAHPPIEPAEERGEF